MYYQKLLNRSLGIIFSIILVLCLTTKSFAFTSPPYIPVQKPTPTATKTVCASGCDYKTLEDADQAAKPGWLIKVKAGTYNGNMTWNSSGISGNEIVVEAFGDGDATFDVGTKRFYISGSYVIFEGGLNRNLIFDGSNQVASGYDKVIYPNGSSNHVTLSRIVARNSSANYSSISTTGTNISGYGDYMKIYNCEIYGAMDEGIYVRDGDYIEVRNNIVHDNCGTGIQVNPHGNGWSDDELIIAGNAIYNNGFCKPDGKTRPGIGLLSNDNTLYDVYVYNNLIWNNKAEGIGVSPYSNINARIYNNTVYNNTDNGVDLRDDGTITVQNNIVCNNGGLNWESGTGRVKSTGTGNGDDNSTNNLTSNCIFESTSPLSPDYMKLSPSSISAINAGVDLHSVVNIDYYGNFRPINNAYDIGAHEYTGTPSTIRPEAPKNLRIVLQ